MASISSRDLGRTAECALRPDRATAAPHAHRPEVAVVREGVQVPPHRATERRRQRGLRDPRDVPDGCDPQRAELPGGHLADSPEPLDGQRMQEGKLSLRRHDQEAVGLRHAARDLGEELRPGHADRDRQADALAHVAAQSHGDLDGGPRDPLQPAHVEERLVDRQPLDQRRRVFEHPVHRLARLGVGRHARLDDDRPRAQPAGLCSTHRRADAVRLGFVAGCQHHAPTDDHRPAAQTRIVSLLDRGVERIQVGVQDPCLACQRTYVRIPERVCSTRRRS